MDKKKVKSIDEYLTKQGKKILFVLYHKKSVCSSDLANFLNVQRNSMSNALARLKKASDPLLSVRKRGRQELYTLTELGRAYVETVLKEDENAKKLWDSLFAQEDIQEEIDVDKMYHQTLECLKELDEADGSWEEKVNGTISLDWNAGTELLAKFNEFLSLLQNLKQIDENRQYFEILNQISDAKVRKCVDVIVHRRYTLGKFWEILDDKWKEGYKIIDTLFDIKIFLLEAKAIKELYSIIEQNDLWSLIQAMQELMSWAFDKGYTKEEFEELLMEEGADDTPYLKYLGQRYKELCR